MTTATEQSGEWRIRNSFSTVSPTSRIGFLVYLETHIRDSKRCRVTCLNELGSVPLASVEHSDVVDVVVTDFIDETRDLTTWLCVFHGEEHVDSVGRTAIGPNATILTSYPLSSSSASSNINSNNDSAPRVSPLFGVRARGARAGIAGVYVFGSVPTIWKVPLATRSQSIIGTWVSSNQMLTLPSSLAMSQQQQQQQQLTQQQRQQSQQQQPQPPPLDLMMASSSQNQPTQNQTQTQGNNNNNSNNNTPSLSVSGAANVFGWCLLSPYSLVPIFVCGVSPDLDGSVIAEFIVSGDATIVVFLGTDGNLRLFAVETALSGDALIWHVIPGSFNINNHFLSSPPSSSSPLLCDVIECQVIPSTDPLRSHLWLRVRDHNNNNNDNNFSKNVLVLETPPLRTESAFFPLDQPSSLDVAAMSMKSHLNQFVGGGGPFSLYQNQSQQHSQQHNQQQQQFQQQQQQREQEERNNNNRHADLQDDEDNDENDDELLNSSSQRHNDNNNNNQQHASPSPQRYDFFIVKEFSHEQNIISFFPWSLLSNKKTFVPFMVVVSSSSSSSSSSSQQQQQEQQKRQENSNENADEDENEQQQQQQQQQEKMSTTTTTTAISVYSRSSMSPRSLELVGQFSKKNILMSASSCYDAGHISSSNALSGSLLMLRDSFTHNWIIHFGMPHVAANSVDFFALCTIKLVLPLQADALYRQCVSKLIQQQQNHQFQDEQQQEQEQEEQEKGTITNLQQEKKKRFLNILAELIVLSSTSGAKRTAEEEEEERQQPKSRKLFSPWRNTIKPQQQQQQQKQQKQTQSSSLNNTPAAVVVSKQLRQLVCFSLHLLCESLKSHRIFSQQLDEISSMILIIADSCDMLQYSALYRDSLLLPSSSSSVNNNDHHQEEKATTTVIRGGSKNNNNNNKSQTQQQEQQQQQQQQEEEKREPSLPLDTLRQFFDNIPSSFSTLADFDSGSSCGPLDFFASLRWLQEGLEPPLRRWPVLKMWNTETTNFGGFDPFRHAASIYAFCVDNNNNTSTSNTSSQQQQGDDNNSNNNNEDEFLLNHPVGRPPLAPMTRSSVNPTNNNNTNNASNNNNNIVAAASVIDRAVRLGWNSQILDTKIPASIAKRVHEAVDTCGEINPTNNNDNSFHHHHHHQQSEEQQQALLLLSSPEALELAGRQDIVLATSSSSSSSSSKRNSSSSSFTFCPERQVQREVVMFAESLSRHVEACSVGNSLAQVLETETTTIGPFSQVRTERVHALLSATSPIPLPSSIDPAEAIQSTLPLLVRRAVAVAVGRGMLNLSTHNFRERDRVPVPPLVLTGLTADGLVIQCEQRLVSPDTMRWPTFHNACAAALRFLPLPAGSSNQQQQQPPPQSIPRHWIVHQARDTQHRAGVLLAVGLLGHLSSLQLTDIYSIFVAPSAQDPQREPLTIAMLLGLGCSFRRTRSEAVFRCLAVHLQSLTPNGEDVEVSLDVQSAALIALGLVFEGTAQSFLVDMLLNDMSRPPSDQLSRQREGYALASGAALGFMLLGQGRNHNLPHLGVEERLLAMLEGDRRDSARPHLFHPDSVHGDVTEQAAFSSTASASCASASTGTCGSSSTASFSSVLGNGGFDGEKMLTRALVSQSRSDYIEPCNTVFEGKKFNAQITGPAAAIALGLMFMKTRDEWIARHLDLPSTLPLIDSVSPQLSLLRVCCATLIRWPAASNSSSFGNNSNSNNNNNNSNNNKPPKDIVESYLPKCLVKLIPLLKTSIQARELDTQAQYRSLHLGYAHAGAALGVGMSFAGTLLSEVKALLLASLEGFTRGEVGSTGVPQAMIHKKAHSFDPCLASTAIAASLVVAGTGDSDVLRVLNRLLKRGNFTYGTYMAISSAIGMLFLGGGRYTLSNSLQSVATLLLSFYPHWPGSALDNTHHLQALRHFYSLSVVPRWLSTFDVETGRTVTTSARIVMSSSSYGSNLLSNQQQQQPKQKKQRKNRKNQQQQQDSAAAAAAAASGRSSSSDYDDEDDDDDENENDYDDENRQQEVEKSHHHHHQYQQQEKAQDQYRDLVEQAKTWTPVLKAKTGGGGGGGLEHQQEEDSKNHNNNVSQGGERRNSLERPSHVLLSQQQQQQQQQQQRGKQQQRLTSFPVLTPCLLPEISNIDSIEIREPGYFKLTISNPETLFSRAIAVKRKPQLFSGTKPRVFGPNIRDASVRDALVFYHFSRRSLNSVASTVAAQDISLLVSPSSATTTTSISSSQQQNTSQQLLERLEAIFNHKFIQPVFENSQLLSAFRQTLQEQHEEEGKEGEAISCSVAKKILSTRKEEGEQDEESGKNKKRREFFNRAEWLSHALRFSGMHLWNENRIASLEKILVLLTTNQQQVEEQFLNSAIEGKFVTEVASSLMASSSS